MSDGTLRLGSLSLGSRLTRRPALDWRDDVSLARIGLAAVGLHLFDDAFIQPEAGTSAGDHLVSGGAMLALLALFAVLYPRLRQANPRLAGVERGPAGVWGGTGRSRLPDQTHDGPSGSDFTGLVAAMGGLLLVLVGVALIWSVPANRRPLVVACRSQGRHRGGRGGAGLSGALRGWLCLRDHPSASGIGRGGGPGRSPSGGDASGPTTGSTWRAGTCPRATGRRS